jgi:pleiotropic regulator 1
MEKHNFIKFNVKKKVIEKWIITKTIHCNTGWISVLSFNHFLKVFATGSFDNKIYLWNINSFKNLSIFKGHKGAIHSIIFDNKSNYMFSGGEDCSLIQWDIESNSIIRNYTGHINSIVQIVKNPTLNIVISSSSDTTIRIWDCRVQKEIMILYGHKNTVTSLLNNKESPHLISGSLDNTIRFWDLAANDNLLVIENKNNGIKAMCKILNDEIFATLYSKSIIIYKKDGKIIKKINSGNNFNNCFAINRKNDIAVGCSSGYIKYINSCNKNRTYFFKPFIDNIWDKNKNQNFVIGFNEKGDRLFAAGVQKTINIFSKNWFIFK